MATPYRTPIIEWKPILLLLLLLLALLFPRPARSWESRDGLEKAMGIHCTGNKDAAGNPECFDGIVTDFQKKMKVAGAKMGGGGGGAGGGAGGGGQRRGLLNFVLAAHTRSRDGGVEKEEGVVEENALTDTRREDKLVLDSTKSACAPGMDGTFCVGPAIPILGMNHTVLTCPSGEVTVCVDGWYGGQGFIIYSA
jgi:hypothetical protein